MKTIYFIHFEGRREPGVEKKIDAQISELGKDYIVKEISVNEKENRGRLIKILNNLPIFYRNKNKYQEALNEVKGNYPIYLRRNKADKYYLNFLKELKKTNRKLLVELPTYPYLKDEFSKVKYWPALLKEITAIPKFKKYVDRFITYSNDTEIFGVPTLKVKNGIYVDQIEPRKPVEASDNAINILAVATFRKHHGYERIITGLSDYYAHGGKKNVVLRMVGEGDEKQKYESLVNKLNLTDHVLFLGRMIGDDLSKQYDIADIALGSFGMYKIDVYNSSVLKVREYLAKGLPIVSGCHEDAFEDEPFDYYLEFPNDKSVVDMNEIITFYDKIYGTGGDNAEKRRIEMVNDIREYAKRQINYDVVFKRVIDYLKED